MVYSLWIGGPYLRSIVVRDAAVTTWLKVAASPIDGVVSNPPHIGDRVGADGRILTGDNPRAGTIAVARARADLDRARERLVALTRVVREIDTLAGTRAARAADYAALFISSIFERCCAWHRPTNSRGRATRSRSFTLVDITEAATSRRR